MSTTLPDGRLLLGIDGGGSKTIALLADLTGRLLGKGITGTSNYQSIGAAAAQASLDNAIAAAFADAALTPTPIAAICLGLAGVGRPEDSELFRRWAAERFPAARLVIVNDAELVLAAGTPDGWGVALICGTGSIVYGRDPGGRSARAGGWGHLLGDEGSGYAIGLAALRAVLRAYDGRGSQTALSRAVLEHWELPAPPSLIGKVYRSNLQPADIAALAALVDAVAMAGDEVAQAILREAGAELALAVRAVAHRLDLQGRIPCALAGGVIVRGQRVREMFLSSAHELGLHLDPVTPVTEPAQGALRLACRSL